MAETAMIGQSAAGCAAPMAGPCPSPQSAPHLSQRSDDSTQRQEALIDGSPPRGFRGEFGGRLITTVRDGEFMGGYLG